MAGVMLPQVRRDDPLDISRQITDIGPRRATSLGEAQTAAYVDGWLRRAGMRVGADTFRAAASLGLTYPALAGLGVGAALLAQWMPLSALLIAVFGLMFAVSDALVAPLPVMATFRDSQNIVATRACVGVERAPDQQPRWRVVLLAPLDSPQVDGQVRWLVGRQTAALIGRVVSFTLLVVLLILLLLDPRPLWHYLHVIPGVYLLFSLVLCLSVFHLRTSRTMLTGGAGALSVLLSAVERVGALREVEIWAVALGATATGHDGLNNLLARYPFPQANTLFVSLQNIEQGQLAVASREGLLKQYTADTLLLKLAHTAATNQEHVNLNARPDQNATSIASLLHSRNYRALTVFTYGSSVPASDNAAQPDTIEQAIGLITHILTCLEHEENE